MSPKCSYVEKKNAIVIESCFESSQIRHSFVTYDKNIFSQVSEEIFSATHWQRRNAIVGKARGRGITWFFKLHTRSFVLRHYYRGGLIGRFLRDQYFFTGLKNSRALREFELLHTLFSLNLPVPRPAACRVKKVFGILMVNDIITWLIPNTKSLVDTLSSQPVEKVVWVRIGSTLRRFHEKHVYHHDLNAHNILLDKQNKVWLIDFDQGSIKSSTNRWPMKNLQRLKRSLMKEQKRQTIFYWTEEHWNFLMQGYENSAPTSP